VIYYKNYFCVLNYLLIYLWSEHSHFVIKIILIIELICPNGREMQS